MHEKKLEIRGINRKELTTYLLQIGATTNNNYNFVGDNWSCQVSEEDHFHMFQSLIPKVKLVFHTSDLDTLSKVIDSFRKKTFRAGG
ncbi:MAG: hypothetical protein ACK4M9_20130 [Anaerobacillus sp.]|uniref:hypothetical protein n=1 Tax=Anaerobacillus sp. TaxID=1872506 RepID=UPI00391AF1D5